MQELLATFFREVDQAGISYCLMRDTHRLEQFHTGGEIDLLIQEDHFPRLRHLLQRLGFVGLPSRGYAPHQFFLAYNQTSDAWLKLDVVTEIAYGRPVRALRTTLAAGCLSNRQRRGSAFALAPEDEMITLLLHCVLDKGYFSADHRQRLQELRHQVSNERYLSVLLISFWLPTMTWSRLARLLDDKAWDGLLADGPAIASRLASQDKAGVIKRQIVNQTLRKLTALVGARRPASLMVALLAPDGAGKSTLAAGIHRSFYFPVRSIYMGLYPQKHTASALETIPGLSFTKRLLTLWQRYLTARYHQARGRLVIFDRYPYDALLPSHQQPNRLKQWRRWLLARACPPPDLVILLDAPGEVLYARKGEHSPAALEQQRQSYLKLKSTLGQLAVIDATCDSDTVRRTALTLIWRSYCRRQAGLKASQVVKPESVTI